MAGNKREVLVTVRGIVVPMMWAEDGHVTAVGVSCFDERDFIVSTGESLGRWLSLLRQEVELTGAVRKRERGHRVIEVYDYSIVSKGETNEAG
jgi:hypothetical protein